jgi:hypothetical protein
MKPARQLWCVAIAFLISIALNGVLLTVDFSIDPRKASLSRIEDVVVRLLKPAEALTMWLVPGHSGAQLLALGLFSLLIYAAATWLLISLPIWWRHRI